MASLDHKEIVRRTFFDVVPTRIPQRFSAYIETVTTPPPPDLRSMSRKPLSMQRSTADPRLSLVQGLLRCCMVPPNRGANIMLSLEDVLHARKMACLRMSWQIGGRGRRWK